VWPFVWGAKEEGGPGVRHSALGYGQLRLQAGKCEHYSSQGIRTQVLGM
jgi:hypothetical protein